jgi:anti-sigma factor RsiW
VTDREPDDISQLLPFYVAGTLAAAERAAVEKALAESPALADEVAFWRGAAAATRARGTYEARGHLPADLLVALAEEPKTIERQQLRFLERHLEICSECRGDYDRVRASLAMPGFAPQAKGALPGPKLRTWLAALVTHRPAVTALAAWVLVAVALVWGPQAPEPLVLRLDHASQVRSGAATEPVTLRLQGSVDLLVIHAEVPHSSLAGTSYELTLMDARSRPVHVGRVESVQPRSADVDELKFRVNVGTVAPAGGRLRAVVAEILPAGSRLSAETYEYEFELVRP